MFSFASNQAHFILFKVKNSANAFWWDSLPKTSLKIIYIHSFLLIFIISNLIHRHMQIFIHIYTLMSLSIQWHLFCRVPKCQYIVSLHLLINFVIDISCTRVCRVSDCSPPHPHLSHSCTCQQFLDNPTLALPFQDSPTFVVCDRFGLSRSIYVTIGTIC